MTDRIEAGAGVDVVQIARMAKSELERFADHPDTTDAEARVLRSISKDLEKAARVAAASLSAGAGQLSANDFPSMYVSVPTVTTGGTTTPSPVAAGEAGPYIKAVEVLSEYERGWADAQASFDDTRSKVLADIGAREEQLEAIIAERLEILLAEKAPAPPAEPVAGLVDLVARLRSNTEQYQRGILSLDDIEKDEEEAAKAIVALEAALHKALDVVMMHHKWQLNCGVIGIKVDGEWIELDSSAEYGDSSLYEVTATVLDADQREHLLVARIGSGDGWWKTAILERRARKAAEDKLVGMREALQKIAELRYVEDANEPFDDALDIADAALLPASVKGVG